MRLRGLQRRTDLTLQLSKDSPGRTCFQSPPASETSEPRRKLSARRPGKSRLMRPEPKEEEPMHPREPADQLPQRDVQLPGGVPALNAPRTGRHTIPAWGRSLLDDRPATRRHLRPPDERPSHMSSGNSVRGLSGLARLQDRPLWIAGQKAMAGHLPMHADSSRCRNPRCAGQGYPCTPARTAIRLELASRMSFHKRMTALTDALTCAVSPPPSFSLAAVTETSGVRGIRSPAPTRTHETGDPVSPLAAVV
jgi:hypothetical protein